MALGGMNGGKANPWRGKPKARVYGVKSAKSAKASPFGKVAIRLQRWEVIWKAQAPSCIAGEACIGSWATVWNWYPTSPATATLTIKRATIRQACRVRLEHTKLLKRRRGRDTPGAPYSPAGLERHCPTWHAIPKRSKTPTRTVITGVFISCRPLAVTDITSLGAKQRTCKSPYP
jgi:hypothetical protein